MIEFERTEKRGNDRLKCRTDANYWTLVTPAQKHGFCLISRTRHNGKLKLGQKPCQLKRSIN